MKKFFNSDRGLRHQPKSRSAGQALLIVVLVMVVSLTVVLSVASRSITNLRMSKDEESSQRAFSAAEAGIEAALKATCPPGTLICSPTGTFPENNANFKTEIKYVSGNAFLLNNGNAVSKDDGIDVWLVEHNNDDSLVYNSGWHADTADRTITVYWDLTVDTCAGNTTPAIEIIVVSGLSSAPATKRYAIDPCSSRGNNFDSAVAVVAGDTIDNKTFQHKTTIPGVSRGIMLRVIPLYADAVIGVRGSHDFPKQGKSIESTGNSGGTARKITYFQRYPELPIEFFGYVLFSTQ